MGGLERLRSQFDAAMSGADNALAAADRLYQACVELLEVDGASISLLLGEHASQGTFGSSGQLSRRLDALQFTFGEGPCLDAVRAGAPVLVADLEHPAQRRWPAFTGALLEAGVRAVFALPVRVSFEQIGALDLYRNSTGSLSGQALDGGLLAAELAALPLLDLMSGALDWSLDRDPAAAGGSGWEQLASLERVEVYQATGMIMEELDVDPTEALVRLRGQAFARGMTASELALAVVQRRLSLDTADWHEAGDPPPGRWQ